MKPKVILVLCLLYCSVATTREQVDPRVLLSATIETLRENVVLNAARIEKDPTVAMALADEAIAPYIDWRLVGRLILGRYWPEASATQQQSFIDSLRRLLLRLFALHVHSYIDARVVYDETKYTGEHAQRALVSATVSRAGYPDIAVSYRLRRSGATWKVFDVSILGVSLIKTYRLTILSDLRNRGLDAVIDDINARLPVATQTAPLELLNPAG